MTSRYGKQYHIPVAIQGYAEASGSVSGSSGRRCTRCQARMRRGHDQTRTLCDPCHATMHPYQPRQPRTNAACEWCGRACHLVYPAKYCSPTCSSCARRAFDNARKQRQRDTNTRTTKVDQYASE